MAILLVCVARLGLPGDKLSKLSPVIARSVATKQTYVIAKPKGLKQSPPQSTNRRRGPLNGFRRLLRYARNDDSSQ
jgi:hypothetical protein